MNKVCPSCQSDDIIIGEISSPEGLLFTPEGENASFPMPSEFIRAYVCRNCGEVVDVIHEGVEEAQQEEKSGGFEYPIQVSDFEFDGSSGFSGSFTMWGEDVCDVDVDFSEDSDDPEADICKYIAVVNEKLNWLGDARDYIARSLIAGGIIGIAEQWCATYPQAQDEEQVCYVVDDGSKVFLPITEEDFINSIHLDNVTIDLSEGAVKAGIQVFLRCRPDYFACHAIVADIDAEGVVTNADLAG
ncbi:MAG TPA: hypothetical protein DCO72_07480 [Ruminococcus sp.]|nr:hypothetical protein [Ruminococcus sp.]